MDRPAPPHRDDTSRGQVLRPCGRRRSRGRPRPRPARSSRRCARTARGPPRSSTYGRTRARRVPRRRRGRTPVHDGGRAPRQPRGRARERRRARRVGQVSGTGDGLAAEDGDAAEAAGGLADGLGCSAQRTRRASWRRRAPSASSNGAATDKTGRCACVRTADATRGPRRSRDDRDRLRGCKPGGRANAKGGPEALPPPARLGSSLLSSLLLRLPRGGVGLRRRSGQVRCPQVADHVDQVTVPPGTHDLGCSARTPFSTVSSLRSYLGVADEELPRPPR